MVTLNLIIETFNNILTNTNLVDSYNKISNTAFNFGETVGNTMTPQSTAVILVLSSILINLSVYCKKRRKFQNEKSDN